MRLSFKFKWLNIRQRSRLLSSLLEDEDERRRRRRFFLLLLLEDFLSSRSCIKLMQMKADTIELVVWYQMRLTCKHKECRSYNSNILNIICTTESGVLGCVDRSRKGDWFKYEEWKLVVVLLSLTSCRNACHHDE